MAAWFGGKIDLNSIKNQVANTLKDVLDEEDEEEAALRSLKEAPSQSLKAELSALKEMNQVLESEKEREIRQLKDILIEKEEEIKELQGWTTMNNQESPEEASHLVRRIQELEASLKEVSKRKLSSNGSTEDSTYKSYEERIQQLTLQLQEKSLTLQELQTESTQKMTEYQNKLDSTKETTKEELQAKDASLSEQMLRIQSLESDLSSNRESLKMIQTEMERIQADNNVEMTDLKNIIDDKEKRERLLTNELSELKASQDIKALSEESISTQLQQEYSSYKEEQVSRIKNMEEDHASSVKEKDDTIEALQINISTLESQMQSLASFSNEGIGKEKELQAVLEQNKSLKKDLTAEKQSQKEVEERVKDLSSILQTKEIELKEKSDRLEEFNSQKESLIKELQCQLVHVEGDMKTIEEHATEVEISKAKEILDLNTQIELLQEENSGLQSDLEKAKRDSDHFNEDSTKGSVELSSQSSLQIKDVNTDIWRDIVRTIFGTDSVNDVKDLSRTINTNLQSALKQLNECQKEDNSLQMIDVDSLSIDKTIQILDSGLLTLSNIYKEQTESLITIRSYNEDIEKELKSKEEEVLSLNQALQTLKESNETFQARVKEMEALTSDLKGKCQCNDQKLQSNEKELISLQEEKTQLLRMNEALEGVVCQMKSSESERLTLYTNEKDKLLKKSLDDEEEIKKILKELKALKDQKSLEANKVIDKLSALVNEKDLEIDTLRLKASESSELQNKVNGMLKERQEMIDAIQLKHEESVDYHDEVQRLRKVVEVRESEISKLQEEAKEFIQASEAKQVSLCQPPMDNNNGIDINEKEEQQPTLKEELDSTIQELMKEREEKKALIEEKNGLQLSIKEKEYDLLMAKKNIQNVEGLLKEREESSEVLKKETNKLSTMVNDFKKEINSLKQGKEDANTVSVAKDRELMELRREVNNLIDKKRKLEQESERLKQHLVSVEEGYTQDAIEYQGREQDLQNKLMSTQEALRISSAQHSTAVQEANQLGGSLVTQVSKLKDERDNALKRCNKLNKDFKDQSKAVENLQMALDGFRREQENEIRFSQQYLQDKLKSEQDKIESQEAEIQRLRAELDKSKESVSNKQSLIEQLEHKSHVISTLKQEINSREELLRSARAEVTQANQNQSIKVDKNLIKNLVVGYAAADNKKKTEVLKIIGTVLDFTPEERRKSGLDGETWSWFRGSQKESSGGIDTSLASAFVKFLETESSSNGSILVLPNDSPKPLTPVPTPGHTRNPSTSSVSSDRNSPNPLLNNPSNNLPTFSINRSSSSILKHVLIEEKDKQWLFYFYKNLM